MNSDMSKDKNQSVVGGLLVLLLSGSLASCANNSPPAGSQYSPLFNSLNRAAVKQNSGKNIAVNNSAQEREPEWIAIGDSHNLESLPADESQQESMSPDLIPKMSLIDSQLLTHFQDDIEAIWYVGDLGNDVGAANRLTSNFFSVIEFKNGSATTDVTALSEVDLPTSQRKNPERWGKVRVRSGVFSFKLAGDGFWREPDFAARTQMRNLALN